MRMKRLLLATTALASLAGAGQAQARDLYISVIGGANFLADEGDVFNGGDDGISFDADTGFLIGGAIGTNLDKWQKGLRVELEASYRRNDLGGSWFTNADTPPDGFTDFGLVDGNMSTFAIMANLWYDIDIGSKVRPYVGGGVGWGRVHAETQDVGTWCGGEGGGAPCQYSLTSTATDNNGFAWQLGLGFNYEVMPGVDVGLGYQFFQGPGFHDQFFDGEASHRNQNHAVTAKFTVGIDAD